MNIIVIIADTWRADYLGCYGNDWIQTPNLDQLAAEGVVFTNCYADGLPTIPARRVYFTGKSILPMENGWRPLYPHDVTFPEVLQKDGFTTSFIADTYHYFKPNLNFHKGFNSWSGFAVRKPTNGSPARGKNLTREIICQNISGTKITTT